MFISCQLLYMDCKSYHINNRLTINYHIRYSIFQLIKQATIPQQVFCCILKVFILIRIRQYKNLNKMQSDNKKEVQNVMFQLFKQKVRLAIQKGCSQQFLYIIFNRSYAQLMGYRLTSLQQFINRSIPLKQIKTIELLKKITHAILNINQNKLKHGNISLRTIYIKSQQQNQQYQIITDPPIFPQLYKPLLKHNSNADYLYQSQFYQMAIVFLLVVSHQSSIEQHNIKRQINKVHFFYKEIIQWMLSISSIHLNHQQNIAHFLKLYLWLQKYERVLSFPQHLRRQKIQCDEDTQDDQLFVVLFKIYIFIDQPNPVLKQSRERMVQQLYLQNTKFTTLISLLQNGLVTFLITHLQNNYLISFAIDDNQLILLTQTLFNNSQQIFEYLKRLKDAIFEMSQDGAFVLRIKKKQMNVLRANKLYNEFTLISNGQMIFNESPTYQSQNKIIEPSLRYNFNTKTDKHIMKKVANQLFKIFKYIEAAVIYRLLIQSELQQALQQQTYGKGNEEDMVELSIPIYSHHEGQQIIQKYSLFDSLFICEYFNLNLQVSFRFYQQIYQQQCESGVIIYGILNSLYQNQYFSLKNDKKDKILKLCVQLKLKCSQTMKQNAYLLLANIYYDFFKNKQMAGAIAKQILLLNSQNIGANIIIHKITNQKLPKQNNIRYKHAQILSLLKEGKQVSKCRQKLQELITENPYFRRPYYNILQILNSHYNEYHQTCNIQEMADKIQKQYNQHNLKVNLLKYKRAKIYQQNKQNQQNATAYYKACVGNNPYFFKCYLCLLQIQSVKQPLDIKKAIEWAQKCMEFDQIKEKAQDILKDSLTLKEEFEKYQKAKLN